MTREFIYNFISRYNLAVISTVAGDQKPEAALVGIVISSDLEIVFDTVNTSRKYRNIVQNPFVALVIGWDNETTMQYEGRAALLNEKDDHLREVYFDVYPDSRERTKTWPGLVHFKITPTWVRYSNFNEPVVIEEMNSPF